LQIVKKIKLFNSSIEIYKSKSSTSVFEKHVTIKNKRGLHARAAARFSQLAEQFDSEINVEVEGLKVSARSIMGLMMLGAGQGVDILITAEGVDAKESLTALEGLIKNRFDEE